MFPGPRPVIICIASRIAMLNCKAGVLRESFRDPNKSLTSSSETPFRRTQTFLPNTSVSEHFPRKARARGVLLIVDGKNSHRHRRVGVER